MQYLQWLTLSLLTLPSSSAVGAEPVPPVPVRSIEVFNPTFRNQTVQATCAGSKMSISWSSNSMGAKFAKLEFNKQPAPSKTIGELNELAAALGGDVLVAVECNNEGAIIRLLGYESAGSGKTKQILLNYIRGNLSVIRKYNTSD